MSIDCDVVARAEPQEGITKKIAKHAVTAHDMMEIPEEILAKVRFTIHGE
jgi:predicted small metal-binding protein